MPGFATLIDVAIFSPLRSSKLAFTFAPGLTSLSCAGFPWGRHLTLSSGVISQLNFEVAGDSEPAAHLMVDASVSYGSSGGGVFDAQTGALIGLVEGYRTARLTSRGQGPEWYIDVPLPGQTVVTPLADIRRFLSDTGQAAVLDEAQPWWRRGW